MTEFELVTIALSFIIGFAVTAILAGLVSLLTRADKVQWDWLPLAWAAIIFGDLVMFWFGALYVERSMTLTLGTFWALVMLASLLFLAGSLILPSNDQRLTEPLGEDFARFGRRALIPLGIFEAGAAATNLLAGEPLSSPAVYLNAILAVLALVAYFVQHRIVRRGATLVFAAIMVYGIMFIWARPGAMDQVLPG